MKLVYKLVGYDRDTEDLVEKHPIPAKHLDFAKKVAGVYGQDVGGDVALNASQARDIAGTIGVTIYTERRDYFLEPYIEKAQPRFAAASRADAPTTTADLDTIKSTLRLSVKDLAKVLGVSRQAIYDWKSGAPIKTANLSRLSNLKAAADIIAGSQLALSPLALTRKLPGGQTLFERLGAGRDGAEAAQALLALLTQEAEQQKLLSQKIAGRTTEHTSGKGVQSFDDWA